MFSFVEPDEAAALGLDWAELDGAPVPNATNSTQRSPRKVMAVSPTGKTSSPKTASSYYAPDVAVVNRRLHSLSDCECNGDFFDSYLFTSHSYIVCSSFVRALVIASLQERYAGGPPLPPP